MSFCAHYEQYGADALAWPGQGKNLKSFFFLSTLFSFFSAPKPPDPRNLALATLLPSRQSSSSMLPSSTYSAITNRPLRTGRRPIQQFAVANPGQATKMLHSILQILTGYYPVLFSTRYFHRSWPWLQKALCPTKSFRRRKNITTRCDLPSRPGRRRMAYLPCHRPTFRTYATTSGPNTLNRSPTTLQSPPSTNFNPHSTVPSSTVRTNMPLHSVSTAHVSTTNPLKAPFKIHPFSNNYQTNHPQLCPHWSNPSIANMEKLILGQ